MEFTIRRTIRRRARFRILCSLAVVTGTAAWTLVTGSPPGTAPLLALALLASAGLIGLRDLARLGKPFRLRIDDGGITLHDARLPWHHVESAVLFHPPITDRTPRGQDDAPPVPPKPRLVLTLVPGVALPRRPDTSGSGGRSYTVLNCEDLDQPIPDLADALRRHAGPRLESAPPGVLPAGPVDVVDPRRGGPERLFTAGRKAWRRSFLLLVAATAVAVPVTVVLGPPLWPILTLVETYLVFQTVLHWRRPLRLRVGPAGIGVREATGHEVFLRWEQFSAVTCGGVPGRADRLPWLAVYSAPGAELGIDRSHTVDGHQIYALVRLDRLPDRGRGVPDAIRAFAADRYADAAPD
ncbi:hypothetical protein ACFVFS_06165 [Kitasatospora sp. NPDC057692]|uniref:hypothetical protein n=1 Tax=Kitasatospora sp. NPDC057692 TaxID=3346215 RepID=UPI0036BF2568